jgi:hypothetical protein
MGHLTYNEVDYLVRGMDSKFKNTPTKPVKKETLRMQFFIRDKMVSFMYDPYNVNKTLYITQQEGELIMKKLEYTFKKRKCAQGVLYKLTSV